MKRHKRKITEAVSWVEEHMETKISVTITLSRQNRSRPDFLHPMKLPLSLLFEESTTLFVWFDNDMMSTDAKLAFEWRHKSDVRAAAPPSQKQE
jgi:hypothetical protein